MGTVKPWMALTLITPFEASPVLISVDVIGMPWSRFVPNFLHGFSDQIAQRLCQRSMFSFVAKIIMKPVARVNVCIVPVIFIVNNSDFWRAIESRSRVVAPTGREVFHPIRRTIACPQQRSSI